MLRVIAVVLFLVNLISGRRTVVAVAPGGHDEEQVIGTGDRVVEHPEFGDHWWRGLDCNEERDYPRLHSAIMGATVICYREC